MTEAFSSEALEASRIDGWMELDELEWLIRTAGSRDIIIEVGSWKGRSTKALALGTHGLVYAVDHWKGSDNDPRVEAFYNEASKNGPDGMFALFSKNLNLEILSGKLIPIRLPHQQAPLFVAELLGSNKADMVFIDGDHRYESVKRDITGFRHLLRPGGLLSGHDYCSNQPGVIRAVDEMLPRFGRGPGTIWYSYEPK